VPELQFDLMDTAKRVDLFYFIDLDGMGPKFGQTCTRTQRKPSKNSHNGHKTAWDGNGLYSPPGANLVHLLICFGVSLSKHSPLGFFFFFFLYLLFSYSWDGFTARSRFDNQLHLAELH
jgi:hypothetical protein